MPRALVTALNARHKTYSCVLKYDTAQTTTMSGLPQQRYGSITQTRGQGDGSKATASRYVKIKGTFYRPNSRGKMNDLTAKNAFRR